MRFQNNNLQQPSSSLTMVAALANKSDFAKSAKRLVSILTRVAVYRPQHFVLKRLMIWRYNQDALAEASRMRVAKRRISLLSLIRLLENAMVRRRMIVFHSLMSFAIERRTTENISFIEKRQVQLFRIFNS
jgi:hypothetical protein